MRGADRPRGGGPWRAAVGALGSALVLLALGACRGEPPSAETPAREATAAPRPPAAFRRDLVFYGAEAAETTAVALAESARVGSDSTRHGLSLWLLRDEQWRSLAADTWETEPLRRPWQVIPHGPVRLLVGDAGELEAVLVGRSDPPIRLEAGDQIDEWNPSSDVRLTVRSGRLEGGGASTPGLVVDLETGADGATAAGAATAVLTDGAGTLVVLARLPHDAASAWVSHRGEPAVWEGTHLAPPTAPGAPLRILSAQDELLGELSPAGGAPASGAAGASGEGGVVAAVSGTGARGDALDSLAEARDPEGAPADTAAGDGLPIRLSPRLVSGWIRVAGQRIAVTGLTLSSRS